MKTTAPNLTHAITASISNRKLAGGGIEFPLHKVILGAFRGKIVFLVEARITEVGN